MITTEASGIDFGVHISGLTPAQLEEQIALRQMFEDIVAQGGYASIPEFPGYLSESDDDESVYGSGSGFGLGEIGIQTREFPKHLRHLPEGFMHSAQEGQKSPMGYETVTIVPPVETWEEMVAAGPQRATHIPAPAKQQTLKQVRGKGPQRLPLPATLPQTIMPEKPTKKPKKHEGFQHAVGHGPRRAIGTKK